jgi:hypothetical protein
MVIPPEERLNTVHFAPALLEEKWQSLPRHFIEGSGID